MNDFPQWFRIEASLQPPGIVSPEILMRGFPDQSGGSSVLEWRLKGDIQAALQYFRRWEAKRLIRPDTKKFAEDYILTNAKVTFSLWISADDLVKAGFQPVDRSRERS